MIRNIFYVIFCVLLFSIQAFASDNYDFRKSHWGDTKKQVISSEKGNKLFINDKNKLVFSIKVFGYDAIASYEFENNKLVSGGIATHEIRNHKQLVNLYNKIISRLKEKYTIQKNTFCEGDMTDLKEFMCKYSDAFVSSNQTHIMIMAIDKLIVSYDEKEYSERKSSKSGKEIEELERKDKKDLDMF